MSLKCSVTLADLSFENLRELMNAEVTLGSEELSSGCKITLSDPGHRIAERLINHSLVKGGIVALEGTVAPPEATVNQNPAPGRPTDTKAIAPNGSMAATGAEFTPSVKAMLDTVAKRETQDAKDGNFAQSYYAKNGTGYFTDADTKAGGGFPLSQGRRQNIGRYQVNRGDWEDAQKYYKRKMGFSPVEQDLIAYWKLRYRDVLKPLAAGDLNTALTRAGNEWASVPHTTRYQNQVQPGTTKKEYTDYYAQRLAFYSGQKAPAVSADPKPINTIAPAKAVSAPKAAQSPPPIAPEVIKGSLMTVNIEGTAFEFYHQGTETNQDGITVLTGQGVRWLMSRRKRSRTFKAMTLRTLAETVAQEHKVRLDYQATIDPEYDHLDQSGISDYKLLLREVQENGLMLTESKGSIVIKERKQLQASPLLLQRGHNLISYNIADKAMGTHDDAVSKYLAQEAKTAIDPISGVTVTLTADVDRNGSSNAPTGKGTITISGTLKAGKAQQTLERGKTKRVSGLPSTFVVPLSLETLQLTPLSTCITEGFPGVLDRIWVIKDISHDLAANETTLALVSPVEVNDDPVVTPEAQGAKTAQGTPITDLGGWVYPCTGFVSSLFGLRNKPTAGASRNHRGTDIGNGATSMPVYAARAGVIVLVKFGSGGAGNMVHIKHDNGYTTEYMHLAAPSELPEGTKVGAGTKFAMTGQTGGTSTGVHLHFGIISASQKINPSLVYKKLGAKGTAITALEKA